MLDRKKLEADIASLPLYVYHFIDPKTLEFTSRVRHVCQSDCPMYGKSWACPPGVGTVELCRDRCLRHTQCLLIGTIAECADLSDLNAALATRNDHEKITDAVRERMRLQGVEPYILSTESCAVCARCAYLDGLPCRRPEKMHPCVESHGINLIPTLERLGLAFQYGDNVVTWYSLLFFNEVTDHE